MSSIAARAAEYGISFLDPVPPECLETDLIKDLSVEWARYHCLLPVNIKGESSVLTADPDQVSQLDYLSLLVGRELRPVLADRDQILEAIERCYFSREDTAEAFLETLDPSVEEHSGVEVRSGAADDLLESSVAAPVTQLVNLILLEAVKKEASDIHFESYADKLRVRFRVDGQLYEQTSPPKHLNDPLISRLKIMAHMDIAEKRLPQDGMAKVRVGEREIDLRVSTIPVPDGERVVLRVLDSGSAQLSLSRLGMGDELLHAFEAVLAVPHGMNIVCGPTGSGKTTTLYAALGCLDSVRRNILTIEDPIEYQLANIGQIQVKPKIGLTFANGLRHILRQDPDIVLVGETRDAETAEISVRAALTGHLVFTTLHTNDSAESIPRMIDMGIEPYLLASCLRGVLAQRLVRVLCDVCRRETRVDTEAAELLGRLNMRALGQRVFEPVGCERCLEGFRGRTGIFELLRIGKEEARAIHDGGVAVEQIRQIAGQHGLRSMAHDGFNKALSGVTSVDEIRQAVALDF